MLHPIFSTVFQRPDLVMVHLSAYGALVGQETKTAGAELARRALAWLLAVMCGSVFFAVTGIALMLGFLNNQFHWVLVGVPCVALLATVMALIQAKKPLSAEHFPELKAQLHSDANALRFAA
jgi:Kef-type K+ transport system membrane component KefB